MAIAELMFLRGEQILLHVRLDRAETCIGSNPTNDVVVPDSSVPDVAALLIDRGAHRYRLRDLTGGKLTVRGAPLDAEEVDLEDGDSIGIGPYVLKLQIRAEEDSAVKQKISRTALIGTESKAGVEALVTFRGDRHLVRPERPFNIGGDEDNDLVIGDEFVSSFHCRISCRDGRWWIADLESTNGTEVNNVKVRESELPIPATIRIGRAMLSFDVPSRSTETSSEPQPVARASNRGTFHGMIAESATMRQVFTLITRFANTKETVLITGESGSGKELVAQALHERSNRKSKPYLALNCGALSSGLIEGELFGYMKGAFTGATSDKAGAFEATDGGTLFLDEIGELPLELQPKLLRVLESSRVRRIGGTRELPIDTRVVAATHRNLSELMMNGDFREDLYHRLVLSIPIPPLRDRPEDVLPLVRHFLSTQAPERKLKLDKGAEEALANYSWPGNIRELRNVIVRAILMTDGDLIAESDLQFSKDAFSKASPDARGAVRQLEQDERERMVRVLEQTDGNRAEAARLLGLSKSTFHDRLKRYGIPLKK